MKTQRVGYIRVSTIEQNQQRQLEGIEIDRLFTEYASGKDLQRPELQAALRYVREGDIFVVHSMDRLARNVEDMLRLVREMNEQGVAVQFIKENMIFSAGKDDPRSSLMFTMLGAFAQFERALMRERQREGIAIAKAKGIYKGRKRALNDAQVAIIKARVGEGTPKTKLAAEYGVSRETIHQYVKSNPAS